MSNYLRRNYNIKRASGSQIRSVYSSIQNIVKNGVLYAVRHRVCSFLLFRLYVFAKQPPQNVRCTIRNSSLFLLLFFSFLLSAEAIGN